MEFDHLSHQVIGLALEVHKELGSGLLESSYEECLAFELQQANIPFQRQLEIPLVYKNVPLSQSYRINLLINNELIVELKSSEQHHKIFEAQLLTYMKLTKVSKGLLINFNTPLLKNGIKRFVL